MTALITFLDELIALLREHWNAVMFDAFDSVDEDCVVCQVITALGGWE